MSEIIIDLSKYRNHFSVWNKMGRMIWNITWLILFRPFFPGVFGRWRIFLLKCFGARLEWTSSVYSTTKIWAPWNLEMGAYACLGPYVDCYNQGKITIKAHTTISQKSYLCASSHDISDPLNTLIVAPIIIEDQAWVAADAFIGPGVHIGQGAVIGARSAVFSKVEPWTVVGGNPARFIKPRIIKDRTWKV
ncbi:MAG: hypothetical protein AB2L24_27535 [Mangrovibacterium sp.]